MNSLIDISQNFQLFYEKILREYLTDKTPADKWSSIAILISDNYKNLTMYFNELSNTDEKTSISLDYSATFDLVQNQIKIESDPLIKISFIILAFHKIVYNLITSTENYYLKLSGKEQMAIVKNDLNYFIVISQTPTQNILFHAYILIYALESLFTKYFYIGVDFEYTLKKIKLAQLSFEHSVSLDSIIYLVAPHELDTYISDSFINLIMCNKYISKILHGADSLDIEYVYPVLLGGDHDKIIKFTKTMIDTRFLCEYYKINHAAEPEKRCAIYDEDENRSAIYYFGVVSKEQQDALADLLRMMPDADTREWNIHKILNSMIMYAQYDVLFLKYFYYRMIHVASSHETSDLSKKNVIDLYKKTLIQLTQWVYLENKKITTLRDDCKKDVDAVNNYFVKNNQGILKMIDIYNKVSKDLRIVNPPVNMDNLLNVNHFKKPIEFVIKRIIYGHISRYCTVYKNKNSVWTDKMSNKFILDFFAAYGFDNLLHIFKELNNLLESKVKAVCQK